MMEKEKFVFMHGPKNFSPELASEFLHHYLIFGSIQNSPKWFNKIYNSTRFSKNIKI